MTNQRRRKFANSKAKIAALKRDFATIIAEELFTRVHMLDGTIIELYPLSVESTPSSEWVSIS